jgi:poly(A) polymerase
MTEPRIVPRAEHPISRKDIDPDALRVLYRLRQGDHIAYLVGGSVRDLWLGRRPKDFDVGTSAHPQQVKRLFRNCWIIGRRFRLAHVKFGTKVIEVATFRRQVGPGEEVVQDGVPAPDPSTAEGERLVHHDNTFGTPEQDAFRRDFTVNALFYDIATFAIIDYVGGLDDLRDRLVRSIGDPNVRFVEDPVRMLRAVALAARLDFRIDRPILDAIATHRHAIATAAPPRMLEEYYKILRAGSAERTFRDLAGAGLLEPTSIELHQGADDPLWQSLARIDRYRSRFESTPETLTNAVLLGTLLVPLGIPVQAPAQRRGRGRGRGRERPSAEAAGAERAPSPRLGELPLARRDVEQLAQILALEPRLLDLDAPVRAQRSLLHRAAFRDALTWIEIHRNAPDAVEHWQALAVSLAREAPLDGKPEEDGAEGPPPRRRRRRRRRRGRRRDAPPQE